MEIMDFKKYKILKEKQIVAILDGDETFGKLMLDKNSATFGSPDSKLSMPYLSGPDICRIAKMFGSTMEYGGNSMVSRWQYMFDLIDYGVSAKNISQIIAYLFDKSNFTKSKYEDMSKENFNQYYEESINSAIDRINSILHFGNNKLVINGKQALIVPSDESIELSIPNIKTVDRDYIKILFKRSINNIDAGNYDSSLTQARTILEETFDYVLEKKKINPSDKGNIKILYTQVKNAYNLHANKKADKRIDTLISGLEKIVDAVTEMRNKDSDAHGVGEKRLKIDRHHARLAVNASITMADFILSVEKKANGESDY